MNASIPVKGPRPPACFKPVTAGSYTCRFTGHRLGDVVAGTVTGTKPDGSNVETQSLGGVERMTK